MIAPSLGPHFSTSTIRYVRERKLVYVSQLVRNVRWAIAFAACKDHNVLDFLYCQNLPTESVACYFIERREFTDSYHCERISKNLSAAAIGTV